MRERIRINHQIKSPELRVIDSEGGNFGVISREKALDLADERGLDLIEISPGATPPVAKIMDYGKYKYEESKKQQKMKAGSHATETKTIQVKVETGEHDLETKAKQASAWLKEGHRVRVNLFLHGRYKFMDDKFLKERLERILRLVTENFKIAEGYNRGPKGRTLVIEREKK